MSSHALLGDRGRERAFTGDPEIRSALRTYLDHRWAAHPDTCFIEELRLRPGHVRIDLRASSGVKKLWHYYSHRRPGEGGRDAAHLAREANLPSGGSGRRARLDRRRELAWSARDSVWRLQLLIQLLGTTHDPPSQRGFRASVYPPRRLVTHERSLAPDMKRSP